MPRLPSSAGTVDPAVAADQQRDPRARADAPDAYHLTSEIGQFELLEQHASVPLERLAVPAHQLAQRFEHLLALAAGRELLDRHDQRRLVNDPSLAVNLIGQFRERRHAVLRTGLRQRLLGPLDHLLLELGRVLGHQALFSISRCEYHTSRFFIPAKPAIAVRY